MISRALFFAVFFFFMACSFPASAQEGLFQFEITEKSEDTTGMAEEESGEEAPPAPLNVEEPDAESQSSFIRNEIYNKLPPEDQERMLEETAKVYEYCTRNGVYSSYFDCDCVAARFFDERLLYPGKPNIIYMADQVAKECPNIPGVAGYAYTECMGSHVANMKLGQKEFCECYANRYAEIYKEDPRAFRPHMARVGTAAILQCDATGIASPLNPDRY